MITCNRCGKENQDHYKFCLGCGNELAKAPAAPAPSRGPAWRDRSGDGRRPVAARPAARRAGHRADTSAIGDSADRDSAHAGRSQTRRGAAPLATDVGRNQAERLDAQPAGDGSARRRRKAKGGIPWETLRRCRRSSRRRHRFSSAPSAGGAGGGSRWSRPRSTGKPMPSAAIGGTPASETPFPGGQPPQAAGSVAPSTGGEIVCPSCGKLNQRRHSRSVVPAGRAWTVLLRSRCGARRSRTMFMAGPAQCQRASRARATRPDPSRRLGGRLAQL